MSAPPASRSAVLHLVEVGQGCLQELPGVFWFAFRLIKQPGDVERFGSSGGKDMERLTCNASSRACEAACYCCWMAGNGRMRTHPSSLAGSGSFWHASFPDQEALRPSPDHAHARPGRLQSTESPLCRIERLILRQGMEGCQISILFGGVDQLGVRCQRLAHLRYRLRGPSALGVETAELIDGAGV